MHHDAETNGGGVRPRGSGLNHSWRGILLVWLAVALPFSFLYVVSRRSVINEVRHHAMGVAIAAAVGLENLPLQEIWTEADMAKPAYHVIQHSLARLIENNQDIRYIYTMRRSPEPFSPPHALVYVVDGPARDYNGDGVIGVDEVSEKPGTPYDASRLPELVAAWDRPGADPDVTPDPPYPDLLSGYAPIRGPDGTTQAIVGVDITARTLAQKLRVIQLVIFTVWLLICVLATLIIHLYYQQRDAFSEIKRLNEELAARHELIRQTNLQLSALGIDPSPSNSSDAMPRMILDRYDLRAVQAGQAPSGVFDLDQDHVAFYFASISGPAATSAMVSRLVRIALSTLVQGAAGSARQTAVYADLHTPSAVLRLLGTLVAKELPPGDAVDFCYGVIDLARNECTLAVAGSNLTILRWQQSGRAEVVELPANPALRFDVQAEFAQATIPVLEADRILVADITTLEPAGRTAAQVGSTLLAAAMQVRSRPLLEQVTQLAAPFPLQVASMLAIEVC